MMNDNIITINPKHDAPLKTYELQFEEDGKIWGTTIQAKSFKQAESLISEKVKLLGEVLEIFPE